MWDKITVGQFQAITKVSNDTTIDDTDKACRLISIIYNMPLEQVEDLEMDKFNELAAATGKMLGVKEMPGKPVRTFKANGKKYGIVYDVSKLTHRQYVESVHWSNDTIANMHLIIASIVQPVSFFGKWGKNKAENHAQVAKDILDAPITVVYHTCVFFCKVYMSLLQNLAPKQIMEMKKKMPEEMAIQLWSGLENSMAGFIPLKRLPTFRTSQ